MTYTLAQLRAFTTAAAQDDSERVADLAVATRMAMGAPAADWTLYLASLRGASPQRQKQGTVTHG